MSVKAVLLDADGVIQDAIIDQPNVLGNRRATKLQLFLDKQIAGGFSRDVQGVQDRDTTRNHGPECARKARDCDLLDNGSKDWQR